MDLRPPRVAQHSNIGLVVHCVCAGVLYEPRQCSLVWDYIPESEICFCINLHCPSGPHAIRPIQKLLNCQTMRAVGAALLFQMGSNQKQRCGSEFIKWHDIYTPEECADEWRQNNADLKLLCHEWFHYFWHHVHDGHCIGEFATVLWCLDSFTVSIRGDDRGESVLRKFASVNRRTPQWHVANLQNYYASLVSKNGVM